VLAGAASALSFPSRAQGSGKLTLYMGPPEKTCAAVAQGFEKKSGIKPTFLRLSAGEAINRIRAERNAPQASVLYGIGLPSMLTLKSEGLLEPYKSPEAAAIPAKYKDPDGWWTGSDADFIGIASNKKFLQEKGLKAPQSWEDLAKPQFAGQICVGSPATSGTGYTFLTTIIQLMGEQKGWEYLKRFNANVSQYTRSGIGPTQLVGRGEVGVGILFAHDILGQHRQGLSHRDVAAAGGHGLRSLLRRAAQGRARARRSEALHRLVAHAGSRGIAGGVRIFRRAGEPEGEAARSREALPEREAHRLRLQLGRQRHGPPAAHRPLPERNPRRAQVA
jgi:iron(III) transport system substrate-binding protein